MEKLEQVHPDKMIMLNKFGTDLTKMAQEGNLDSLVGRVKELERVRQILCNRRKNNPCLLSDPGVGKTVIVEGLAQNVINSTIPSKLRGKKVGTEKALIAAAQLSHQYISEGFQPDKAMDLIDEAGARVQPWQARIPPKFQTLTEDHIQETIALWTGIPVEKVSFQETVKLLNMENTLQKRIIGQHKVVEAISHAIRRARVGVRDPSRPIASFLFTGPTGVVKTEMAKALAVEYYGSKDTMIRVDMSEYMEKLSVSKFGGSPPRYVGYDEGGQLTESVYRMPHTVILFDEIEKAQGNIFDIVLQIFDDGRLTDNKGRLIDFKNTIIIMTANVGGTLIDEFIVFHELNSRQVKEIADVMLKEVSDRVMKLKNIKIEVTESFKEKLVKEGYKPSYGARPLRRAIVRLLEDTLAERILKGYIKESGSVTLDIDSNGSVVIY
ncbi:hypothetical protein REPUB_Repub10bG0003400 [Reevesia pubescens]